MPIYLNVWLKVKFKVDSEYCTLQDYEISANGLNLKQNYGYWQLQNLKPHTQYKLTLQRSNHKILLDVYTKEDSKCT